MPSKKYMAGIPFTYRQIMGSVTVYFSKSKQCFIAQFRTANPAGGRALEYETRTTLQNREQIRDYLASEEGIKAQKALYAKYAEKMAEDFPAQIVQCSARQTYELLEATAEFRACLAREIGKGRKNTANQKDTLDRALLTKYLDRYGDTPLYKIDNAQKKMVAQDLAGEDPRYTAYQMQRCHCRLELMQRYAAGRGWMEAQKQYGKRRWDAQAQKRSKLGTRCLSHTTFRAFLKLVTREALQDGRAVGVLCLMLEGLSLEEICGLWYEDIVTLPDSSRYSLRIMRPYIRMEGSRMQFGKKTVYPYKLRYVPVCGVLKETLKHRMEHVPARFVKKIHRMPVVCCGNQWEQPCTPEELTNYCKDLLKKVGFDAGTYKKTDDSSNYQEEKEIGAGIRVLCRTFEAIVEGHLRQGKKEHLQGLAPKLLMDRVYRDYQCGGYQEAMARKLDKTRTTATLTSGSKSTARSLLKAQAKPNI